MSGAEINEVCRMIDSFEEGRYGGRWAESCGAATGKFCVARVRGRLLRTRLALELIQDLTDQIYQTYTVTDGVRIVTN